MPHTPTPLERSLSAIVSDWRGNSAHDYFLSCPILVTVALARLSKVVGLMDALFMAPHGAKGINFQVFHHAVTDLKQIDLSELTADEKDMFLPQLKFAISEIVGLATQDDNVAVQLGKYWLPAATGLFLDRTDKHVVEVTGFAANRLLALAGTMNLRVAQTAT